MHAPEVEYLFIGTPTPIFGATQHAIHVTEVAGKHVPLVEEPVALEAIGTIATLVMDQVREEIVTTATEKDIN